MLKHTILLAALLFSGAASAQKAMPEILLASAPVTSLLPVLSVTPVALANGVRYEYQLVRLDND